ncbi:hypothetical protein UNDYM_0704 [Undibacterium sp. YM2]|nr:hypothetical protein UNDYM_0704 [Undibacterium sp. YM2]
MSIKTRFFFSAGIIDVIIDANYTKFDGGQVASVKFCAYLLKKHANLAYVSKCTDKWGNRYRSKQNKSGKFISKEKF